MFVMAGMTGHTGLAGYNKLAEGKFGWFAQGDSENDQGLVVWLISDPD